MLFNTFDEIEEIYLNHFLELCLFMGIGYTLIHGSALILFIYQMKKRKIPYTVGNFILTLIKYILFFLLLMAIMLPNAIFNIYKISQGEKIYASVECVMDSSINMSREFTEYFCKDNGLYYKTKTSRYDGMGILKSPNITIGSKYKYYYILQNNKIFHKE